MIILLYSFIAWIVIALFCITPKALSKIINVILFFYITIMVLNIKTITTLNLRLIKNTEIPYEYICLLMNRNIIIPLCVLIFINLFVSFNKKSKKIGIALISFLTLIFADFLPVWIGIKTYIHWNVLYDAITLLVVMTCTFILVKVLTRLNEVDQY